MAHIRYKNYTLEQEGARFNLYKTVNRKVKRKDKDPEFMDVAETVGYSFTLNGAIERIAFDIMESKSVRDIKLEDYLKELRGVTQDIMKSSGVSSVLL